MEKSFKLFLTRIGRFFAKNWITGIVALFCAMVLWGFVLADQKPDRVKTLNNIPLSFEGEADLMAQKLVVCGNREEILPDVSVKISAELLSYADLSTDDITATVSLRNISKIGEYELTVRATSSIGTVLSVSPSKINVTIDRLTSKNVPIEINAIGSPDANYWYSDPIFLNDEIEIEGALSVLSTINRAVGEIDISNHYDTFSDAVTLSLIDSNGEKIDNTSIYSDVPSATVQVEIMPKKHVQFDLEGALEGVEDLPANYEISSMFTIPGSVVIVGDQSALDSVDSLKLSSIDVLALFNKQNKSDGYENDPVQLSIIIPNDIRIIGNWTTVDAYINIREKTIEKTFSNLPITLSKKSGEYTYSFDNNHMDITISGRISLLNRIEAEDIELVANVANLAPGTHNVKIDVNIGDPNKDEYSDIDYKLEYNELSVTISKRS